MIETLSDLARFLGKNFGEEYNYQEGVIQFAMRLLTELKNQNRALKKQLEEAEVRHLSENTRIRLGLPIIKKLLCGEKVIIQLGDKKIELLPDDDLNRFSNFGCSTCQKS